MSTVTGYLSGVSPSLLAFLVFGTTKAFQRKMYRTFVPRFLRKQDDTLTSMRASQLPFSSTNNSSHARSSTLFTPRTPNKHYRSSSSVLSPPEPTAFAAPGTPKTLPRQGGNPRESLRHYRSDASLRKPEPIIVEEERRPPPRNLQPIYEPGGAWLEDTTPPESLRRSQIGIAVGAPSSPATSAAVVALAAQCPTFLRDADEDSVQSESKRESGGGPGTLASTPQVSIPLSRFNNNNSSNSNNNTNGVAVGHRRHMSGTGSFTQIWSEGRRPSGNGAAASSARLTLGQGAKPGRDYSHYVAPMRRSSAA